MEITQLPIKEVKCVHAGQRYAYGDSFYEYEIHLEPGQTVSREDIIAYCFAEISKRKVQTKEEWRQACGDMGKHFAGYYELYSTDYGYKYIVCLPYTD